MYVPACLYLQHITQVPVEARRQHLTHWNQSYRYDEPIDGGPENQTLVLLIMEPYL